MRLLLSAEGMKMLTRKVPKRVGTRNTKTSFRGHEDKQTKAVRGGKSHVCHKVKDSPPKGLHTGSPAMTLRAESGGGGTDSEGNEDRQPEGQTAQWRPQGIPFEQR